MFTTILAKEITIMSAFSVSSLVISSVMLLITILTLRRLYRKDLKLSIINETESQSAIKINQKNIQRLDQELVSQKTNYSDQFDKASKSRKDIHKQLNGVDTKVVALGTKVDTLIDVIKNND
jgi:esterase/lipase